MSMRSPHWRWPAAEFLLLERFSNGVNTYTRGNCSGTSGKNDTVGYLWVQRSPQVRQPRSDVQVC